MAIDSFERDLMQWNDAEAVREEERERYRPLVEAVGDLLWAADHGEATLLEWGAVERAWRAVAPEGDTPKD